MSWFKSFVVGLIIIGLSGCGFSPVYGEKNHIDGSDKLPSIEAKARIGRLDKDDTAIYLPRKILQNFSQALSKTLNPSHVESKKQYKLEVALNLDHQPLLIQRDRTITRSRVKVTAVYTLVSLKTKKTIVSGNISREGDYDQVESDYATFVSQQGTLDRVIKEIAEGLKIRLISVLLRHENT